MFDSKEKYLLSKQKQFEFQHEAESNYVSFE